MLSHFVESQDPFFYSDSVIRRKCLIQFPEKNFPFRQIIAFFRHAIITGYSKKIISARLERITQSDNNFSLWIIKIIFVPRQGGDGDAKLPGQFFLADPLPLA